MEKYLKILKNCMLFDDIEDDNLKALLGCLEARIKVYKKREIIISEGEPAKNVGIVLSGSVQVMQIDYFGNRSIVSNISKSQLFGESFACAGVEETPVDTVANEDCEIMFINCARIMRSCCNACTFHSQMIYNLMKNMAVKNIMFHRKIQITAKRTTREKLMEYLLQQAKEKDSTSFIIPFNRQELADFLEVDRSGLSVEISKLRDEGILESYKNSFKLITPEL